MAGKDVVSKTINVYEKVAEKYYKMHLNRKTIKWELTYFVKNIKGKKILDAGCGPGFDSRYFSDLSFDVTGIDLTKNFIKMAKKLAPKAKFRLMDMRNLDFPKNSFDGLWVCASLLHLPKKDVKKTLIGFWDVLKPNGMVFIAVKHGRGERFVKGKKFARFFAFYEEKEIGNLVKSAGFKILYLKLTKNKKWVNVFATK